ncbi:MAG: hypothetical protein GXX96_08935 [Planctomycetaceae bacterium]|nr:hypothetical protein [Planctomycetaceae bacterium]
MCYHVGMADYQDENPYASPQFAAEPAVPETHGIWRDGDELVVLPRDMKAPKACWVTNRTGFVLRCRLVSYSRLSLALNLLIFIPLIGFLLYPLVAVPLVFLGYLRIRTPTAWLCWGALWRQWAGALACGILMAIAFGLSLFAGFSMSLTAFLMSVPFIIAGLIGMTWSDRLTIGLYTRFGENGTYCIRGVHPDYLARLPAYNESDTTSATTIELGESPFVEPAL